MTPVLSRAEMRAFDAYAIETCRVPGLVLMENAGRGAADVLARETLGGKVSGARVVVVCGTGDNGGDGFVIARHLACQGALVWVAGDPQRLPPDARAMFDAWRGMGGPLRVTPAGAPLADLAETLADARVVVDALFGTGLDRPIEGWMAEVIAAINAAPGVRFAVDLPSGLDADTGVTLGSVVHAHVTATFAHPKRGLRTPEGARWAGDVHVVGLGVPGGLAARLGVTAYEIERSDVARFARPRAPGAHKTSSGHVLVIGGSPGRVGAPQLVARGALRSGAGLVTVATWPHVATALEAHVLEVMIARIEVDALHSAADAPAPRGDAVGRLLEGKHAVVIGPGLGLDDDARRLVTAVIERWEGPLVVDADALSLFAGRPEALRAAKHAILTPHPGELGRLLRKTSAQVERDRYAAAREIATASGAVVALKGAHTLVAGPESRLAVSPIAAPVLGTAGSGDTLGGIIAALACGMPPFEAACAGVLLHGLAGEAWSRAHGGADRGMVASDIAEMLPSLGVP